MRRPGHQREISLPIVPSSGSRLLTAREFQVLADVPAEAEWFANIDKAGTKRIYATSFRELMTFVGIGAQLNSGSSLAHTRSPGGRISKDARFPVRTSAARA